MSKFTRYMLEVAPPGEKAERFIKKNKKAFTARYGDKGKNVLYATAWKMFGKKESVDEAHSAGYKMPKRSNETEGNFEVKWANNKKGPIYVSKGFKTHADAKDWLAAQQKDDKRIKGIVVNKDFKIDRKRKTRKEEVAQVGEAANKPYPSEWKVKKSHQSTVAHDATKKYIEKSGYANDIKRDKPKNVIAYVARRKREEREKKTNEGYGGLSKAEYEKAKAKPQKTIKKSPPVTPMSTSRVIARALKRSKKPSQRLTSGFSEEGMIGRTKPSRELNVSRDEKPYLAGKSSLKAQKRAAHKAERAKAKKKLKQPVSEAKRKMGNVKDVPVYREIEGKKGHHEVVGHVHRSAKSVGAAKVGNAATARQTTKLKSPEFPEGPGWIVQDNLR